MKQNWTLQDCLLPLTLLSTHIYQHESPLVWLHENNCRSCLLFVFMNSQMMCHCKFGCLNELWDGIISCPFVKGGSVHPMLKEMGNEALKLPSFEFRACRFKQLIYWLSLSEEPTYYPRPIGLWREKRQPQHSACMQMMKLSSGHWWGGALVWLCWRHRSQSAVLRPGKFCVRQVPVYTESLWGEPGTAARPLIQAVSPCAVYLRLLTDCFTVAVGFQLLLRS